jgi:hypothetical protein
MPIRIYHDFVLFTYEVQEDEHGQVQSFKVRVFDSPVGQGEQDERVPDPNAYGDQADWYDGLQKASGELEDRAYDSELDRQRDLGTALGRLLLPDHARALLRRSYDWLKADEGLRLRLRLEPQLSALPWEYIYLNDSGDQSSLAGFIALNPRISIVRHEALEIRPADFTSAESQPGTTDSIPPAGPHVEHREGDQPSQPLSEGAEKRRIVIAMATPQPYQDYPPLRHLPQEQMEIREALDKVMGIDPEYRPQYRSPDDYAVRHGATFEELRAALSPKADIFHFSGHGEFEKRLGPGGEIVGEGWLILADEDNQAQRKSADDMRRLIEEMEVRLVVLGACESAQRDRFHKLSSVSVSLLQGRIPCVVAMQFRVLDPLAAVFMEAFYEALVAGLHIDEAVALGRATVWNTTQADGWYRRDWGVPVLYLRTPGGRIFPPVTDEEARGRAERRSSERFDLNRAWWDWMAEGTVATHDQLQRLAAAGEDLQLTPVQVLLLLRSAVKLAATEGVSTAPWISRLRQVREQSLSLLDESEGDISEAGAQARRILGLETGSGPGRPTGPLAASAVQHKDWVTRQTAAMALIGLEREPQPGLETLERTLDESARWPRWGDRWPGRWWRRAELRGALADAASEVERLNARLPPWDRLGAWLWRVGRRLRRDGRRLVALLVGATLGAALGLGTLRFAIALVGRNVLPAVQFALYSYWGGILGLALCLGMLLTDPFLLRPLQFVAEGAKGKVDVRRFLLAVALGTVSSGVALLVLALLGGLKVVGRPLVAPLGFLFGLGISLAVYGQPAAGLRMGLGSWLLRASAAVSASVITQRVFDLARDKGLAIAIAWPYTRYRAYFESLVDQWWPGLTARFPNWAHFLGLLDAALAGAVVAIGITVGMNAAAKRLTGRRPPVVERPEGGEE